MHKTTQPAEPSSSRRIKRLQADSKELSRRLLSNNRIPAEVAGWLYSDLLALQVEIAMLGSSQETLDLWEGVIGGIQWLLSHEKRIAANFSESYMRLFSAESADDQIRRFRSLYVPTKNRRQ